MSAESSFLDQFPIPNESDHSPPTKKLKLNSVSEESVQVSIDTTSSVRTPTDEDTFDPVQAILDAGRKLKEEEQKRHEATRESSSNSPFEEDEVLSAESSDQESDADNEDLTEKSSKTPGSPEVKVVKSKSLGKSGKGKKKSSNCRRNIKDILKADQLDDLTLAARKEEEERRQRMNLKLQQLQQQHQLKLLQQQQSQLLRESLALNAASRSHGQFHHIPPVVDDFLLKKLIRKRHITVSLDESGVPQDIQKTRGDDECILLSSDEECDKPTPKDPYLHSPAPSSTISVPSQVNGPCETARNTFSARDGVLSGAVSDDIIALSSGEEDNSERGTNRRSARDVHFYVDANSGSNGISGRSVDAESDDDCVIVSPAPDEDEEVEEKDECSQDLLNVPDHLGRVLLNVGHPDGDEDLFLAPQIARIVKPHQIGGIRFLYDNVIESKDLYNKSAGFGCILAHAMGLGKTLQTVSFCDVILRTVGKTVLIIVPINTIQNWLNEFNRYLPSKSCNWSSSGTCIKKRSTKNRVKLDDKSDSNMPSGRCTPEKTPPESTNDSLNLTFDSSINLDSISSSLNNNNGQELSSPSPSCSNSKPDQKPTLQKTDVAETTESTVESDIQYRNFEVFLLNETVKSLQAREKIIRTWTDKGGVLLLGYEMYRMLALKKLKKSSRKAMTLVHEERVAEAESLNKIYECLVDPGPDCVICDEGHRIKNSGAGISQALKAIKTKRRVVLTGYPLQNNLMEYWCMVDFVRPNYLGTKAEFSNMFERPIQNGQCADSTYEDKRLMKYRSHVLHSLLEGFVQRRSHLVLRNALPYKEEWVFLVKLTPIQLRIYKEFIRYLREDLESDNASANPIKAFAVCCKIWNHPDVLWNVVKKNLDLEMDLDIDEVNNVSRPRQSKPRGAGRPRGRPPLNGITLSAQYGIGLGQFDGPAFTTETSSGKSDTPGISLEWAKPLFENYVPEVMENGVKFEILFQLIDETVAVGDKLLVFSQSLLTLDLIEIFLKKRLDWKKSMDYVRLDGSTAGLEREKLINEFNKSKVQKLFLISTRAGSLGINLVGANRVCIFDASWNPCHDSQAVCRVYRYGQTKPCHIYRFVADCTLEKRIYDRQVNKKGMADRIVDEMNPNTPFKSKDVSSFLVLQHDLLEKLPYIKCDVNLEKYTDPVMKNVLYKMVNKITQVPFEHESLLIDQKHQKLSKSEKRLALRNYEKEKKTVANAYATYSRPSYAQYYAAANSMQSSASYSTSSVSGYNSEHRTSSIISPSRGRGSSRVSSESYGTLGSMSFDKFELHINALKSRGISVFPVELHQDTFLNDPSGAQDIYIRAGDKVYILVSQKGTYLRVQGKILRVPFVGTEMNQEQAEHFVMSLLQQPPASTHDDLGIRPHTYPVEQQLPPSNLMFQKSANHLQITNSRNNSGGDVMMGSSSWNNQSQLAHSIQQSSSTRDIHSHSPYLTDSYRSNGTHHVSSRNLSSHSQSDLQSLSRLAETFCHRPSSSSSSDMYSSTERHKHHRSSSVPKLNSISSPPELEVIKLNHSQSSNSSSTSSNSRTNSPYRQGWNNSNDGSNGWIGSKDRESSNSLGKVDNPAFYTDFTVIPLNSSSGGRRQQGQGQHVSDNYWTSNSRQPVSSSDYFGQVATRDLPGHSLDSSSQSQHAFANIHQFGSSSLGSERVSAQSTLSTALDFSASGPTFMDNTARMTLDGINGGGGVGAYNMKSGDSDKSSNNF